MRRKSLFVLIAVLASLIASAPAVLAQTDCKTVVPPSPWGPNDQTGATNRVTPSVTKAAAAEIQEGKVVVMSYPLTDAIHEDDPDGDDLGARRGARREPAHVHGGHLAQPEPRGNAPRRARAHRPQ